MRHIELRGISRRFGALTVLDGVSIALPGGRVHGVLGENGAGKSTLMNILYGLLRPDAGEIVVDGRIASWRSPGEAIDAGIGMVHQHFMLAGAMSVVDNVLLGDRRQGQWLDRRGAARSLRELSERLHLPIDPEARIETLSVGQQQRVEILKALFRDADTLILDEPTAVLTPQETRQLLGAMARLREEGKSIVFISHKLSEVMQICDDITVLRRGRVVWSGPRDQTTADELARQMVGREVASVTRGNFAPPERASAILAVEHVSGGGIDDVSLHLSNEILGIAGVDGNGQQELAETLVGLRLPARGTILLDGRDVTRLTLIARWALGVAHIPNDRKHEGLVMSMPVGENLALKRHRHRPFARVGVMSRRSMRGLAAELGEAFDIRGASRDGPVSALSGGNQQKVVLARELGVGRPRVIVAMNPTRGLDIAASRSVHQELLRQKEAGCAIVLISSELDELLALSDRVAVLYRGRLTMTAYPEDTIDRIGRLMAGISD